MKSFNDKGQLDAYFRCNAFEIFEMEDFKIREKFSLSQSQLNPVSEFKLQTINVEWQCHWIENNIDIYKSTLIVPIRDNSELLKYTLDNFSKNHLFEYANVIVVDDRSVEDLQSICNNYPVSFLKINNEIGFNFSMLNNIASLICYKLGVETVVFWNSDLWIDEIEHYIKLIEHHDESQSTISGSKLLYPHESLHDGHSFNIRTHFPSKTDGSYKGTVQFGGSRWFQTPVKLSTGVVEIPTPYHFRRFCDKDDFRVNCNYGTDFVTGALQVVELDWFIETGGFNPSLPKVFQDVDLCLKAVEENKKIMYFGKDIHFFHDESYNHYSNRNQKKMDLQFRSDHTLFCKLWKDRLNILLA